MEFENSGMWLFVKELFKYESFCFSPDSDNYRGSYFQYGGRATNHFRIGRGTRVPLQGQRTRCHCLGAIAGCHCSVLLLWGEGDDQLWGVDVVPLLGAIAGCHCRVLWWGGWRPTLKEWTWCHCRVPLSCAMVGGGDDQLWRSGHGAIAGRHCSLLWFGGRVTTNFGGVDVVPLLGAIAGCHCSVPLLGAIAGCHCSVLVEGKAKVNFGGGAIAGAIVVCYGWGGGWRPTLGEWTWCHCCLGEWTWCHCRVPL